MSKTETIKKDEAGVIYPSGETIDISSESYRLYRYQKGENITIRGPKTLYIDSNGDHKIVDAEGQTHIIKKGWMHLKFKLLDGATPELLMEKKE